MPLGKEGAQMLISIFGIAVDVSPKIIWCVFVWFWAVLFLSDSIESIYFFSVQLLLSFFAFCSDFNLIKRKKKILKNTNTDVKGKT